MSDELYGKMPGLTEITEHQKIIQTESPSERLKRLTQVLKLIEAEEAEDYAER